MRHGGRHAVPDRAGSKVPTDADDGAALFLYISASACTDSSALCPHGGRHGNHHHRRDDQPVQQALVASLPPEMRGRYMAVGAYHGVSPCASAPTAGVLMDGHGPSSSGTRGLGRVPSVVGFVALQRAHAGAQPAAAVPEFS
jgi:hypothetical protein